MMLDTGKFFREIEDNCWSAEKRIHECDSHQVNVQVLSTVPVMFSYWAKPQDCLEVSKFLNDHIANIVIKYPKRFVGLGTIPMQAPELAIKELERHFKISEDVLRYICLKRDVIDQNPSPMMSAPSDLKPAML